MSNLNISNAVASNMTNVFTATAIAPLNTEGATGVDETTYTNTKWKDHWGVFNEHPELKSAVIMRAIWDVGKGYIADAETTVILDHISGWGKDTFEEILFNMDICRYVGRDSYAHIIWDDKEERNFPLNVKALDPGSIKIVVDENGILKRYEQVSKVPGKANKEFKPYEIFHLSNNRLADQIHGISVIESLDKTLLADIESFDNTRKTMNRQAKPFIIFHWKTDDTAKVNEMKARIDALRNLGEDLHLPDENDVVKWEVVQVNVSETILAWRQDITNRFYRALGMPLVLFGAQGSTESGGKMEVFAHENVWEHGQRYIENQVWQQLNLKINLIPPQSMGQNLATDESKDMSQSGMPQGLEMQPGDTTPGAGE